MSKQRDALKIALEVLDSKHNFNSAEWRYLHYRAFQIIREALAEPEQEPVAWYDKHGMITHDCFERVAPLYATLQTRKPLTDEQIEDLYFDKFSMSELKAFARAIERAHGIGGGE